MAADQLYTLDSLGTFATASGIVLVITKAVAKIAPIPPSAVSLFVSVAVSVGGAMQAKLTWTFPLVIIVAGNAALLFLAATGANESLAAAATGKPAGRAEKHAKKPRGATPWLGSWLYDARTDDHDGSQ